MQVKILAASRQYGMMNVLPGFSGHVPDAFKRVFPSANLTRYC
jgi:alpha-N-acetylglucosaminidase